MRKDKSAELICCSFQPCNKRALKATTAIHLSVFSFEFMPMYVAYEPFYVLHFLILPVSHLSLCTKNELTLMELYHSLYFLSLWPDTGLLFSLCLCSCSFISFC